MAQRIQNKGNRGFSLVETLAVAAILVILLSLSAVAAAYYRDYLKITELDNAARDIYMAAENRAVLLGSNGQLEGLISASTLAEGGKEDSGWITKDSAAAKELLTAGAIDPTLLDGDFRIIYDPDSFAVTDVFYAEDTITLTRDAAMAIAGDRDKRMRPDEGPMLGYYGGEQTAREAYTPLPAPEVMVVIHNGERLTVDVTFSVPDAAQSSVADDWMFQSKQSVKLIYGGKERPLMSLEPGGAPVSLRTYSRKIADKSYITYTWILDALDATAEERHFWQLFEEEDRTMGFGGDFTVTAEIELSAPGHRSTSASGSDTNNSLFAERSGGSAARLENVRHLQNLDKDTSLVAGKTTAIQLNDIACHLKDLSSSSVNAYIPYEFAPIENEELASYDAGWTGSRRNEITELQVTANSVKVENPEEPDKKVKPGAGLFAKTGEGMTFTGVRLIGADVVAGDAPAAGVLVGAAGSGSTFRDIRVVNSTAVCADEAGNATGPAGGIAGTVAGAAGEVNRFVDCQVYWDPEEGQTYQSLLGSDQKGNPYKYGEILHGTAAGGLAGRLSGEGKTIVTKSLAASLVSGDNAGGLFGDAEQDVEIAVSYADCYLQGTNTAAGLIGTGAPSSLIFKNVYTAGFIDLTETTAQAGGILSAAAGAGSSVSCENVYAAMSYLNQGDKPEDIITRGLEAAGCYYLSVDPADAESKWKDKGQGPVSYDDLSDPDSGFAAMLNDAADVKDQAFEWKAYRSDSDGIDKNTYAYNLQKSQTLTKYSFPGLRDLPHYGDWRAYFKEPSLVYFEEYNEIDPVTKDKARGFSGGNARTLKVGELKEGDDSSFPAVKTDGYAVALLQDDLKEDILTVTYTYLGKDGNKETTDPPIIYSKSGKTGIKLLPASWERKEGTGTKIDQYWLAPLPDKLVVGTPAGEGEEAEYRSQTTSRDFYQYLRFVTNVTLEEAKGPAAGEYFYNPHFAETVKPYVPADNGAPFIDWAGAWTEEYKDGHPPYAPGKAAEAVRKYIAEALTPGREPVSVRTPRHFYHLSQYEEYYNNDRLTFLQELPLDGYESKGGEDKYYHYKFYGTPGGGGKLLRHDDRGFQLQTPIGTQDKPFLGTYDGDCLPIRRLAFEIPEKDKNRVCAGLFGSSNGTLKNIVYSLDPRDPKNPDDTTESVPRSILFHSSELETHLGALVGLNAQLGKIQNCAVEGVNLTTQIFSRRLYVGGLCGSNQGVVQNCAAESARLHVEASNYGSAYVGGLTGQNSGRIETSYAVGRLEADAAQDNAPALLAGFAGLNSGSISNSYAAMALKTNGAKAKAWGFCGQSSGGTQRETYFLNEGNFTYRGESFLADYTEGEGGGAYPINYAVLTADEVPVPNMSKKEVRADQKKEDVFPYPTGVKMNGAAEHYGDWPRPLELGSMGVYYWEELQVPGKKPSYHVSLLAMDPGEKQSDPKTVSKISTLSTAHDESGEVTRYGYGIYNRKGNAIFLPESDKVDTAKIPYYPLLYSQNGEAGSPFDKAMYESLEYPETGDKNAADKKVDEALARLMAYELDEKGNAEFEFHSFHTYGQNKDADGTSGGLYPNSVSSRPNGTLTLSQGGKYPDGTDYETVTVTFLLNPLFADALAVELPRGWTAAEKQDVPTFTSRSETITGGTWWNPTTTTVWTFSGKIPGGSETCSYGVRSIDQLQFINWNSQYRNTNTVLTRREDISGAAEDAIGNFPFLSGFDNTGLKSQTGNYFWLQSYDILGKKDGGIYRTYTPIAEYYDKTKVEQGNLYGWFGGTYDGGSYKIENVNIEGQVSSCAGLFGVVYNARLKNIVLYSSDGEGTIKTKVGGTLEEDKDENGAPIRRSSSQSLWFSMGALAGVAGTTEGDDTPVIENCTVAGYTIDAEVYTLSGNGWGGNNIGGLVGSCDLSLTGCSAVTTIKVHDAIENDNMRIGGLTGICQGKVRNCYAGGSISVWNVGVKGKDHKIPKGIYIGGLVGGSFMKSLAVNGDGSITIGAKGKGENSNQEETSNELRHCYSYVTLPPITGEDAQKHIKGLYVIGGTGDIYPVGAQGAPALSNHGSTTYENCYYLESESLSLVTKEQILQAGVKTDLGSKSGGTALQDGNLSPNNEYPMPDQYFDRIGEGRTSNVRNLENIETRETLRCNENQLYYRQSPNPPAKGIGLFQYEGKVDGKAWVYKFLGWLVDASGNTWTYTTNPDYFKDTSVESSEVTGLTYEQLAGMEKNIPGKDSNLDIYDLLPGDFKKVTSAIKEGETEISVPGKYSYPTQTRPELRDRDYPFPTILTKDGGKYRVHYGDWPLKGFRRQTLFDEEGNFTLLGGSPIEIDLFVNGDKPHQEHLVLTDGVKSGGTWSFDWESLQKAIADKQDPDKVELIAQKIEPPKRLTPDEIPNEKEKGKEYYLFTLKPKRGGTDTLYISYTYTDGEGQEITYTLPVIVHITAAAVLRPSRLFMFPGDTVDIPVRVTDKAGESLEGRVDGKLTLKGDYPNCGSSYLTGEFLVREATEDGKVPTIRFTTSVPEDEPELEKGLILGANSDFAYTVPDPGDPTKEEDHGGGTGGDVRINVIQPWKGEDWQEQDEEFIHFEEVPQDDGTMRVVCTVTFPDSYAVGDEGTIRFKTADKPSVAPILKMPTAEWVEKEGRIVLKLTYPKSVQTLTDLPDETKVSLPLTLTSEEPEGKPELIEETGGQLHTLTLTVKKPAEAPPEGEAEIPAVEALPPEEPEEEPAVRRRRAGERKSKP